MIKFELSEHHVNIILGLLGNAPYNQVAPVINAIGQQIQAQAPGMIQIQQPQPQGAQGSLPTAPDGIRKN
jgi:hypothetical protein